jgi:hypothetical protein
MTLPASSLHRICRVHCIGSIRHIHRAASALALSAVALLTSACGAQKASSGGASYSEPALIGKVIDQETKKPIEGALIYGHYATSSGTLAGGSKFGEHVKSFEAVTDANGNFKLDAWSTDKKISGQPNGKFPLIAVWKPGYGLEIQNLNTIAEFRPRSFVQGVGETKVVNNTVDWTSIAFELKPAKTEIERYDATSNAGYPMMMIGDCGWEIYAKSLLALHNERKRMIVEYVKPTDIGADGYIKSGVARTQPHVEYISRTSVDNLLNQRNASSQNSQCLNPKTVFSGAK